MLKYFGMQFHSLTIGQAYFSKGPLNFSFETAGLYFVEGCNGAGKSTLMKTILRRLKPLQGRIEGRPQQIAYSGIEGLLFQDWTVDENIKWISSLFQQSFTQDTSLLPSLNPVGSYKIRELSSGWKQLTEVLVALSLPCTVTLLDEPFQALDSGHCELVVKAIRSKSKKSLLLLSDHRSLMSASDFKGKVSL